MALISLSIAPWMEVRWKVVIDLVQTTDKGLHKGLHITTKGTHSQVGGKSQSCIPSFCPFISCHFLPTLNTPLEVMNSSVTLSSCSHYEA